MRKAYHDKASPSSEHMADIPDAPEITISPCYESAREELVEPLIYVALTRYFVERWMKDLGPAATAILISLRKRCFYDRKEGTKREEITVRLADISEEAGIDIKTIRRHLESNDALRRFVKTRAELVYDRDRGGYRNGPKSYHVSMTDPIHPSDEQAFLAIVQRREDEREKGAPDARTRARSAVESAQGQNVHAQTPDPQRVGILTDDGTKCPRGPVKMSTLLYDSLKTLKTPESPPSPTRGDPLPPRGDAPGFLTSLFSGEGKGEPVSNADYERRFDSLSPGEQAPWLLVAATDPATIEATRTCQTDRSRERIIRVHARGFFVAAQRKAE